MLSFVFHIIQEVYGICVCSPKVIHQFYSCPSAYSEVCKLLRMIPYRDYYPGSRMKKCIDDIVKKNVLLRGDVFPVGITIIRDQHCLNIYIPWTDEKVRYCLDIYNANTEHEGICREYLLYIKRNNVKIYHDNGYRIYWDIKLCKQYGPQDIMRCYNRSSARITYDTCFAIITITDEEIGFDCRRAFVHLTAANAINPLLTKHFLMDR